jgi:periplasmic copper chaperone A
MKNWLIATGLCLALLVAGGAQAASSSIDVQKAWARASPGGARTGAAYLTILNNGSTDDRLLAASAPVAARVELHISTMNNGVMEMRPLPAVDVKSGSRVVFKPGAMHVMLIDLAAPLVEGQSFPLTLTFEKAGSIAVTVKVGKPGATEPGMSGMTM